MAAMTKAGVLALVLAGCGKLDGFEGEVSPLATFQFEVTGDFESVRVAGADNEKLHVALVWGAQWLPDAICFLPPESPDVAEVVAVGCRDPFGFIPDRVSDEVPADANALPVFALPSADVMVGDVTARIAYASLVVYDDRNDTEGLQLGRSQNTPDLDDGPPDPIVVRDIVYGASFVTMTEPDVRIALREGGYNAGAAFYPRKGCGEPAPGFSVVAAGGFTAEAAIASVSIGTLPSQNPATCSESAPAGAVIPIALRDPTKIQDVGCVGRRSDGSIRYREPPPEGIDMTNREVACAKVPDFGSGAGAGIVQLLVSSRSDARCKGLTHYVLRGCFDDAACAVPDWDVTATPPSWWPCAP
jgi:hypothetical protein